ncbi:MAG TPA: hypothetical protein ENJ80_01485 [Gammaproteobacteria bacterium]|nr:hypothetical protein [Gammaproteobacteria bacterium]
MSNRTTEKWVFLLVTLYLPSSIFFIFWLYIASIIYTPGTGSYSLFYGEDGNIALLWLFAVLLPAVLFLVLRAKGRRALARLSGATGFYCLLGSLISAHGFLALPGFVLLLISVVINRRLKKQQRQKQ